MNQGPAYGFHFLLPMPDLAAARRAEAAIALLTKGGARIEWPRAPADGDGPPRIGSKAFPSPASLFRGTAPLPASEEALDLAWRLANDLLAQADGRHSLEACLERDGWWPGFYPAAEENWRRGATLRFHARGRSASVEGAAALVVGLCRALDLPPHEWEWWLWSTGGPAACLSGTVACSREGAEHRLPTAWGAPTLGEAQAEGTSAGRAWVRSPDP